jgi:predicted CXXCH cytochrome family protein
MPKNRSIFNFLRGSPAAAICILFWFSYTPGLPGAESDDIACIGCHMTQGLSTEFDSSEILPLTIDVEALQSSVHSGLTCTTCHSNIQAFPHPEKVAKDYREFQLENSDRCRECHGQQFEEQRDGNHAHALEAGNRNAAVCIDCHGSHAIRRTDQQPRYIISASCGRCHGAIYAEYIESAHGKALLENSDPYVPGCADCHNAHNQEDPDTQSFRLKSPRLCAKCHGDAGLMGKYGLSADVFNTYVADFHGSTVTLFEKQHPDQPVNMALCIDCHGIHNILETTDKNSTVIKDNLLSTCRRCHPDASATFPDSWVGHFPPSRQRHPLVYYANLFYRFLIPITIGGMILFVIIDAGGRITRRFRKNRT